MQASLNLQWPMLFRRHFYSSLCAAALVCCLPFGGLAAQHAGGSGSVAEVNLEQHLEISDLKTAGPPQIRGNSILFTFRETGLGAGPVFNDNTRKTSIQPALEVKRVAIAFAHEGWAILHPLAKTNLPPKAIKTQPAAKDAPLVWEEEPKSPGAPVFFIYWQLERDVQEELIREGKNLEYRFVVDGVWMADPLNPANTRKMNGSLVSGIDLARMLPPAVISPEIHIPAKPSAVTLVRQRPEQATMTALASSRQARTVLLRWVGGNDQEVFVAGTFNQFDPYLSPLEAVGPDPRHPDKTVYQVELRLLAGQYQYHFVINGRPYLDALNPRYGFDAQGTRYSQVLVP